VCLKGRDWVGTFERESRPEKGRNKDGLFWLQKCAEGSGFVVPWDSSLDLSLLLKQLIKEFTPFDNSCTVNES